MFKELGLWLLVVAVFLPLRLRTETELWLEILAVRTLLGYFGNALLFRSIENKTLNGYLHLNIDDQEVRVWHTIFLLFLFVFFCFFAWLGFLLGILVIDAADENSNLLCSLLFRKKSHLVVGWLFFVLGLPGGMCLLAHFQERKRSKAVSKMILRLTIIH